MEVGKESLGWFALLEVYPQSHPEIVTWRPSKAPSSTLSGRTSDAAGRVFKLLAEFFCP
jgi:hypothetical protein